MKRNFKQTGWKRQIAAVCASGILFLGVLGALGQSKGRQAVKVTSKAEPGVTDPMAIPAGRYMMLPDQGLSAFVPNGEDTLVKYFDTSSDASLNLHKFEDMQKNAYDPYGSGPPQVFAASGRILRSDRDNMVTVQREGNASAHGTRVAINFPDEKPAIPTVYLDNQLLPRRVDSNDFLAVATGDLDNTADAQGIRHDEVVVARVSSEGTTDQHYYRYYIDVLDYSSGNPAAPHISQATFAEIAPAFRDTTPGGGTLGSDTILSLAIGDFTGDGHKDIVLTTLGDGTLLIYTYRYETVNGEHTLRQVGSQYMVMQGGGKIPGEIGNLGTVGTLSSAAGDFLGDGTDQLAVAYAKWNNNKYGLGVLLFKFNSNFHADLIDSNFTHYPDFTGPSNLERRSRPRVQIVAGQFLLSPPSIPFGRKQLMLAWNGGQEWLTVEGIAVNETTKRLMSFDKWSEQNTAGTSFALTAGGLQGNSINTPTSSFAFSRWSGNTGSSNFKIDAASIKNGRITWSGSTFQVNIQKPVDPRVRLFLTSFDRPGNSRYLGSPVHLRILDAPRLDYIMQEPPKFAYWDDATNKVVNFTRFDKNNVHLYNSNTASLSTTIEDTSAWSIGASTAITAGGSVTVGKDVGILSGKSTTSVDLGLKIGYDYNQNKSEYNSGYRERKIASTGQTDRDDFLKGTLQTTDIWRYRIYGSPLGDSLNAFYEIVMPGPSIAFAAGGLNFDWYQPIHENGNLLSYPSEIGSRSNPNVPVDMGEYTLPSGKILKEPQLPAQLNFFDMSSGATELRYSDEVAQGGSFSYSHKIAENLDVKIANKTEVKTPFVNGEARFSASFEAHNSNSWGSSETSKTTTKEETAITLNRFPGSLAQAYPFYTVVYNTNDGTIKLSFAVPNPADNYINPSGAATFANLFGGRPDPALNLPARLVPMKVGPGQLEDWEPNLNIDRKRMRGLFFRNAEPTKELNVYSLFASNPEDGDTIRIEPRVYNLSTGQDAVGTVVEFQVIPFDRRTNTEFCPTHINGGEGITTGLVCPRSARQTIGATTIDHLAPRQFTCVAGFDKPEDTGCASPAYINWNTSGFGPGGPGAKEYRVYVVLNPNGTGNGEAHSLEKDPIAITHVENTTPMVITAPGNQFATGEYVIIGNVRGLTSANRVYRITHIGGDRFSLDGSVKENGTYAGGGTVTMLDPGQNNEGYATIAIAHPQSEAHGKARHSQPKDYVESDALMALTGTARPHLSQSDVQATVNVAMQLRFTAYSTEVHQEQAHMLLFESDPATGAPAIADKIVHPGMHGREGSSIWFSWTPTRTGVNHLYAVLLDSNGIQHSAQRLEVVVHPAPANK